MARASASKAKARDISRGSGNVFADLGFPDAEQRQTKLRLATALNTILDAPCLQCRRAVDVDAAAAQLFQRGADGFVARERPRSGAGQSR
jgi:hypothetical protein